jgi:hypothetical protein
LKPLLRQNQTIGHQFPQVLHLKIFKTVFAFDIIQLPMTAMAWDHDHLRTRGLDLFKLFPGIKNTLVIVTGSQGAATPAAADLIHFIGIKINPVIHALIQNPARLFKIAVAEAFLSPSAIIARVMIGGAFRKSRFIQSDTTFFDIHYKQIKNRHKSKFIDRLGIICFKTRPGRKIGVPSFGPEKGVDFQPLHLLQNPAGHHLHGVIVAGKISPTGSLPIFRGYGPVFFGRMKNLPPVF